MSIPDNLESQPPEPKRRSWLTWLARHLLPAVVAGYAVWCGILYFEQDGIIFPAEYAPSPDAVGFPPALEANRQVFTVQLDDGGVVPAWFLPVPGATRDTPGPAVVFCHGNAEIIEQQAHIVWMYHRMGVSVLLPEYRGYGNAGGEPSQAGIAQDLSVFYEQLTRHEAVDASRIVFHGRSLGGGVACDLASRHRPAALILESTFASAASMAHGYGVPELLVRHPFRNDRIIAEQGGPMLIAHGTRDRIIPVEHGRRLRDLAPGAVYIEYDCGHNDFPGRHASAWTEAVESFLVQAGIISPSASSRTPASTSAD